MEQRLTEDINNWKLFWTFFQSLKSKVNQCTAKHINTLEVRSLAQETTQKYFRTLRPELLALNLDIQRFDELMQELLELASKRSFKEAYLSALKELEGIRLRLEIQRELTLGEIAFKRTQSVSQPNETEVQIIETLNKFVPAAALTYQQAVFDISSSERISFRGTASELREALRETLDYLAPDSAVMQEKGFKLEENLKTPTMKQKVRFILKKRGYPKNASTVTEEAITIVEELTASLVRSVYNRGSISAHTKSEKKEIVRVKRYTDTVLSELLEIP